MPSYKLFICGAIFTIMSIQIKGMNDEDPLEAVIEESFNAAGSDDYSASASTYIPTETQLEQLFGSPVTQYLLKTGKANTYYNKAVMKIGDSRSAFISKITQEALPTLQEDYNKQKNLAQERQAQERRQFLVIAKSFVPCAILCVGGLLFLKDAYYNLQKTEKKGRKKIIATLQAVFGASLISAGIYIFLKAYHYQDSAELAQLNRYIHNNRG